MTKDVAALIFRMYCPERRDFHEKFGCYILENGKFKMPLYHDSPEELADFVVELISKEGNRINDIIRLSEERPWQIPNYADKPITEDDFSRVLSRYKKKLKELGLE
jgi:hypothetical protein